MLKFLPYKDIFKVHSEIHYNTVVITVNCVGVMGKGIALACKNTYPEVYKDYSNLCRQQMFKPGLIFSSFADDGTEILLVATKNHWRAPSQFEWIEDIVSNMNAYLEKEKDRTFAIPALGCGNGGLNWSDVKPAMAKLNGTNNDLDVYEPENSKRLALLGDDFF